MFLQVRVPVTRPFIEYTVVDMCKLLTSRSLKKYEDTFRSEKADGEYFNWHEGLNDVLRRLGIWREADVELLENKINLLKYAGYKKTCFCDSNHFI